MSGPDATLRAKGARLVDQLRRDELPAYTEARERRCPECGPMGELKRSREVCWTCDSTEPTGLVQCDPLDVARLLALCGDEEAAEIAYWSAESAWDTWHAALIDLAAKLPPKRAEVECDDCEGTTRGPRKLGPGATVSRAGLGTCVPCHGTGKAAHDTPAQRWLMVVAAEAVARECLASREDSDSLRFECGGYRRAEAGAVRNSLFVDAVAEVRPIREALDACRAWIAEPTPERERDWVALTEPGGSLPVEWVPCPDWRSDFWHVSDTLLAAADVIGADRVREIASRAIRGAVRGG